MQKNLYNRGNFYIKEQLRKKKVPTFYDLDRKLKEEDCYKILPAHTAQHTLKLLDRNWKAYFQAIKELRKNPNKFLSKPRTPNFKRPKGETIAIVSNQQARIINGWVKFPQKLNFSIKTRLTAHNDLREVRIVLRGVGYSVEIIYYKYIPKSKKKNPNRKGAVDLGLTNLVTFVDNIGSRPIVIKDEGKGIKSITQYYLKEVKELQQHYSEQQKKSLSCKTSLNMENVFISFEIIGD